MSRSRSRATKSNGVGTVRIVSVSRSPGPSPRSAHGAGSVEKGKSGSVVVRTGSPTRSPVRRGRRMSVRDLAAVGRGVIRRARSNGSDVDVADDSSSSASSSRTQTMASTPPTSVGPSDDEGASAKGSPKDKPPLYPAPFLPPSLLTDEGREPAPPPKLPSYFPPFPAEHLKASDKVDKADEGTPDAWVKRDSRLIRLTGKHPFSAYRSPLRLPHAHDDADCEAPIRPLFEAGFLTPAALFYVRNHGAVPRVDMEQAAAWTVEISGCVISHFSASSDCSCPSAASSGRRSRCRSTTSSPASAALVRRSRSPSHSSAPATDARSKT